MGFLENNIKESCFGCRACEEICPAGCITMTEDEETFLYPKIDTDRCLDCGICKKICPYGNKKLFEETHSQTVFAATPKDESEVFKSASGGAFSFIVKNAFKTGECYVCGAAYKNGTEVVHEIAGSYIEAEKFRKSKYVQSNTNGCFKKIKELLKDGKNVIFSGTPCQVAALKSYLGDTCTENLLTIDIICHGVPSQKLFDMYIGGHKKRVINYTFKNKDKINGKYNSRSAKIEYEDKSSKIAQIRNDVYMYAYYTRLCYRPSCANCSYATDKRVSDITLGDAWGIENKYESLDPKKGVSLVIANTEKGREISKCLSGDMDLIPLDMAWATKNNEQLSKPTSVHKKRTEFFDEIKKGKSFADAVKKVRPSFTKRLFNKILSVINRK